MLQQYNREELYKEVWEKPMLRVAEQYGVSSVALGKACRKLSVPVPGRGHWAKLAHGHPGVRKPDLPKLDTVPVVYRVKQEQPNVNGPDQNNPELAAVDRLLSSGALNPPIGGMVKSHVQIRQTENQLRSRNRTDEHGILSPRDSGILDVRVTERMLDRALAVMSQIIEVLETQNLRIEISKENGSAVFIQGQRISFGIEEPIRKIVTEKPRVPNPTDRWDYDRTVTFEPSGMLAFVIHSGTWETQGMRMRWSDAKVQRIENHIPDFVASLMRTAIVLRQKAEARKKQELKEQKRAQELARLRKDIEEEEKKLKHFDEWLEDWGRAEEMRRFIAVYAEKSRSWPAEKQQKYREWIEWAGQQADRLDPFELEKPPSVIDRKQELPRW